MFLESILILMIVGVILVFFYRQAVQEFNILQVESIEKVIPLIQERCPIVVYPYESNLKLWSRQDLQQRPTIFNTPYAGQPLEIQLKQESVITKSQDSRTLADQVGLNVWIKEEFLKAFKEHLWYSPLLTTRAEALIGAQGLRQTYAYTTALVCTEGALSVSLLTEASDKYLPQQWLNKRLKTLKKDDTPHLEKIQYIDVVVRPGSLLLIPPHWKVCWENLDSPAPTAALAVWIEVHHPVSRLVGHLGSS